MEGTSVIYIVFSATPYRMGRFIRRVTGCRYNHVSLQLDKDGPLYSFARRYQNVPLYGGFVQESRLRYRNGNRIASVRVCAVPVTEEKIRRIRRRLEEMLCIPEDYVYNLFSAALALGHRRCVIPRAFTCVEFLVSLLGEAGLLEERLTERFWSVGDLAELLQDYAVYEGPMRVVGGWNGDTFPQRKGKIAAAALTLTAGKTLTQRLINR